MVWRRHFIHLDLFTNCWLTTHPRTRAPGAATKIPQTIARSAMVNEVFRQRSAPVEQGAAPLNPYAVQLACALLR